MQVFKVQGMTCGHCVRAIERSIQARDPQAKVAVDLAGAEVRVDSELAVDKVLEAILAEGYTAVQA
ncbi:cation transporter [Pseudomonas sp. GD03944]|uniref:heavy-metal-associated domain-containing protein n=1 Tax=Pseudomonas sp. GD03944 TaxID=2975409 RepID=UPI00244A7655|nr:cation transporter [Pseudomonas sp. GD03944]MDH1262427.1 cation transporter [Pseudomonas sp. GD03944]